MTKVLIVEDDLFLQRTIKRAFEFHKLPVEVVDDGVKVLKKVELVKPSVILLEAMLSNMNGLEILKKLKTHKKTKNIPVIVLVNFTEEEIVEKVISLGAVDCIVKFEFTPDNIVDKVKSYL